MLGVKDSCWAWKVNPSKCHQNRWKHMNNHIFLGMAWKKPVHGQPFCYELSAQALRGHESRLTGFGYFVKSPAASRKGSCSQRPRRCWSFAQDGIGRPIFQDSFSCMTILPKKKYNFGVAPAKWYLGELIHVGATLTRSSKEKEEKAKKVPPEAGSAFISSSKFQPSGAKWHTRIGRFSSWLPKYGLVLHQCSN